MLKIKFHYMTVSPMIIIIHRGPKKQLRILIKLKKNTNVARAIGTVASDNKKKTNKTTWQIMLEGASPEEKPAYRKILNREYYKRGSKT
jgi:hypothetical protein